MGRWKLFSIIVIAGLLLDQATKLYVDAKMILHQSIPLIDGIFSLTYLRNRGAAFSFLSNASWRIPFFIFVTIIAVSVIIVAMRKLKEEQRFAQVALAMIFSGAVGNLVDRVRLGEVIDFLDIYWRSHHWPAFNVADSLITVGVMMVALDMFRNDREMASKSY